MSMMDNQFVVWFVIVSVLLCLTISFFASTQIAYKIELDFPSFELSEETLFVLNELLPLFGCWLIVFMCIGCILLRCFVDGLAYRCMERDRAEDLSWRFEALSMFLLCVLAAASIWTLIGLTAFAGSEILWTSKSLERVIDANTSFDLEDRNDIIANDYSFALFEFCCNMENKFALVNMRPCSATLGQCRRDLEGCQCIRDMSRFNDTLARFKEKSPCLNLTKAGIVGPISRGNKCGGGYPKPFANSLYDKWYLSIEPDGFRIIALAGLLLVLSLIPIVASLQMQFSKLVEIGCLCSRSKLRTRVVPNNSDSPNYRQPPPASNEQQRRTSGHQVHRSDHGSTGASAHQLTGTDRDANHDIHGEISAGHRIGSSTTHVTLV